MKPDKYDWLGVILGIIVVVAIISYNSKAEAGWSDRIEMPAHMRILEKVGIDDYKLRGVIGWANMGECRLARKYILDYIWATHASGMYVTCTPQEVD